MTGLVGSFVVGADAHLIAEQSREDAERDRKEAAQARKEDAARFEAMLKALQATQRATERLADAVRQSTEKTESQRPSRRDQENIPLADPPKGAGGAARTSRPTVPLGKTKIEKPKPPKKS